MQTMAGLHYEFKNMKYSAISQADIYYGAFMLFVLELDSIRYSFA